MGGIIGALVGAIVQVVTNCTSDEKWTNGLDTAILTGAASGVLAASGAGLVASVAGNAFISMAGNATNQVIKNKGFGHFDYGDRTVDGLIGGVAGLVGGPGMGKSVNFKTLNRNLTRKILNGASKTVVKGMKYYVTQTRLLYKMDLWHPIRNSAITAMAGYGTKTIFSR